MIEGMTAQVAFFDSEIIGIEIALHARKPATLETGVVVQVPLFVEPGDKIKVDTRSGDYITRV